MLLMFNSGFEAIVRTFFLVSFIILIKKYLFDFKDMQ